MPAISWGGWPWGVPLDCHDHQDVWSHSKRLYCCWRASIGCPHAHTAPGLHWSGPRRGPVVILELQLGFVYTSGQIITTSRDLGPQKVAFWKGIPLIHIFIYTVVKGSMAIATPKFGGWVFGAMSFTKTFMGVALRHRSFPGGIYRSQAVRREIVEDPLGSEIIGILTGHLFCGLFLATSNWLGWATLPKFNSEFTPEKLQRAPKGKAKVFQRNPFSGVYSRC